MGKLLTQLVGIELVNVVYNSHARFVAIDNKTLFQDCYVCSPTYNKISKEIKTKL